MKIIYFQNETGKPVLTATDRLDDGNPITLKITIDEDNVGLVMSILLCLNMFCPLSQGSAVFDFAGTGPQVSHNLNTPRQITFSAILYCLRCMVGHDVPLNQVILNMYLAFICLLI